MEDFKVQVNGVCGKKVKKGVQASWKRWIKVSMEETEEDDLLKFLISD